MNGDIAKILRKRDQWRSQECAGCRHNYYNVPKPPSARGDVGVADDKYCWHLPDAKRIRGGTRARCNTHRPHNGTITRCGREVTYPLGGSREFTHAATVCKDCLRALGREPKAWLDEPCDGTVDRMIGRHLI